MATWPFVALLAGAFIANESLKRHYIRFSFQISLFFLSIYSFAIFLVPVVLHRVGAWVFLLSGLLSLVFISVFILVLLFFIKDNFKEDEQESKKMILFSVLGIFVVVNFLYFTNLIPPIPLSLKDAGVYHSIQKNQDGNYEVSHESQSWREYFKLYQNFHQVAGSPAYAYSAIFSPKGLNLSILHEWQRYDEVQSKWITESVINLPVVGGRDGGFRTYSTRSLLAPGLWRVNIKTKEGLIIGHLRFSILPADVEPFLTSELKK
jgi:hypothetical protein